MYECCDVSIGGCGVRMCVDTVVLVFVFGAEIDRSGEWFPHVGFSCGEEERSSDGYSDSCDVW